MTVAPVDQEVVDNVSEEDEEEDESSGDCCFDDDDHYKNSRKKAARAFLERKRHMSEDEAKKFVKKCVSWNLCNISLEEPDEARQADLSVDFNFGKAPFTAFLDYTFRIGRDFACKFEWNGSGTLTPILVKQAFKLKAAHVKAARDASFPDDWEPEDVMAFVYTCVGVAGDPCGSAESKFGLREDTAKLCKNLGASKAAAKKKAPATRKGGVSKTKAAPAKKGAAAAAAGAAAAADAAA